MRGLRLKTRYVLTVLAVGVLLTASVSLIVASGERHQRQSLEALLDETSRLQATDPAAGLELASQQIRELLSHADATQLAEFVGVGLVLTLLAAWVTALLISRIDRAMSALMTRAERIGRGVYSDPIPPSSVPEIAPLAAALEQMRQALTGTTISRNYLDTLLNSMSDAVLVTAPDGRIRTVNAAACDLLGFETDELVGLEFESLVAEPHRAAFAIEKLLVEPGETVVRTLRGQTIPVSVSASAIASEDPEFQGSIFVLRDVTERKRAERRIRYLARFDMLTKMPNRMQFQHLLHQAITRCLRANRGLVLLYIDLDNFKDVNDTFGHATGDRVLETTSERLVRALPKESVLGRLA
jgi:PAS domain S-box-containing protein